MFNSNDSKASFKHLFTSLVTGYLGTSMAASPSAPKLSGLEKSFIIDNKPKEWTTDDCYITGNIDKLVIEAVGRGYEVKFPSIDKASTTPSETILAGSKGSLMDDLCHSTVMIKSGAHPSASLKILTTACYLDTCTEAFISQSNASIEMPIYSDGSSAQTQIDTATPAAVSKLEPEVKFDINDFFVAAIKGDADVIKKLLAAGAKVDAREPINHGNTALTKAAAKGNAEIVKILLAAGANVNAANDQGYTALIGAANNGHVETVEILLAAGANVNARTSGGNSALIAAAHSCHIEAVEVLLKANADPCAIMSCAISNARACDQAAEILKTDITNKYNQGKMSATLFKSCKDKYDEKSSCVIM